jgi:regulator of RNase E activity RraA
MRNFMPGRVLVVDAGGATDRAILGEIMVAQLRAVGAAGVVVDGAVRDRAGLQDLGVPVYAAGVTHCGPYRSGPGEIHGPVSIGGTVVCDGDVIVGDDDGVVVVRAAEAESVCLRAETRMEFEEVAIERARRGETEYDWLDGSIAIEEIDTGNGQ